MLKSPEIRRFRDSEVQRVALDTLLSDGVLPIALRAVEMSAIPRLDVEQKMGVPYDSTIAHDRSFRQGIAAAVEALRGMIYPINQAPSETDGLEEESEFDSHLPKELQLKNKPKNA